MSTSKPRITVTFEAHTYEVLARLSRAGRQSMSQIVAEIVDLAVPSFERVVVVMERAASASEEVREGMRAALDRADQVLVPQLVAAADQGDLFLRAMALGDSGSPSSKVAGGAAAGAPPAATGRPARTRRKVAGEGLTPVPLTGGSGRGKRAAVTGSRASKGGSRRGGV